MSREDDLSRVLRYCAEGGKCATCERRMKVREVGFVGCMQEMWAEAARQIEAAEQRIAELDSELEIWTERSFEGKIGSMALQNLNLRMRISELEAQITKQGEWIPCSERLPEDGSYLVWLPFAPPNYRIAVAEYYRGHWTIKTPVSAWMPLPEPWKGEK